MSIASREGQAPLSDARIKSAQGGAQRELSPRVLHVQGNRGTSRANVAHSTLVVEAVNHLNVRSCLIDGEVVCCDEKGVTSFQLLPFLYAFDLLELNGTDLRREPIEVRKATLASVLRQSRGVRLNEHLEHDCGLTVFQHACLLGCEGIVSKRLGSRYRSGRSPDWLKFKNPEAPAVRREAEEDWNQSRRGRGDHDHN